MLNRLKGSRGYLCGAMCRVPDSGVQWRATLREMTKELEVKWLDPTDKPIDGFDEINLKRRLLEAKEREDWMRVKELVKPIRCVDLRMVDVSDFLVVKLDMEVQQCGTYEELFLANREKKPVIVFCPQGKREIPNWLFGTLPHDLFFRDLDEVVAYLWHVAVDDNVDSLRRWYFFDYERV